MTPSDTKRIFKAEEVALAQPSSPTMDLLNRITNEIRRHVFDTEPFDDITLLAVRRMNLESEEEL